MEAFDYSLSDSSGIDADWTTTPSGSRLRLYLDFVTSGIPVTRLIPSTIRNSPIPDLGNGNNYSSSTTGTGKYCLPYYTWPGNTNTTLRTRSLCCVCVYPYVPPQHRGRVWSAGSTGVTLCRAHKTQTRLN
ncbi:hypothetical protein FKM82_023409 [Ascaphus truei]